jgi:hypothetical protein
MSEDHSNFLFISINQRVMNLKYSVGLDVSSKKINVCMSIIDEKQKVSVKSSCVISNTINGWICK